MALTFEWDARKAGTNTRKHGVSFEEARTAFADPLGRIMPDTRHSAFEQREVLIGVTERSRIVAVMFTERAQTIRIISADSSRAESALVMKKGTNKPALKKVKRAPRVAGDDILPEYDFSAAGPNRYAREYGRANVVALDPDVAAVFPNAESVNRAHRALAGIIRDATGTDATA